MSTGRRIFGQENLWGLLKVMIQEINLGLQEPSFIKGYIINNLSLCDRLIEFFEQSEHKKPGAILKDGRSEVIKWHKDSMDLQLMFHEDITQMYLKELEQIYSLYTEQFVALTTGQPIRVERVNMQRYYPGQGFHNWHYERTSHIHPSGARALVYMTYLNDVNDGGETEFMYQNIKIVPRKGLTLLWPVDWTHTHRGITSPSQTKYIVTGWFQYF
jgi:hypothetical protein